MQYRLKKISGDASFREFYRIQKGSKSSIIVFAKKDKFKNLITYSAVNEILNKNGVLAPRLLSNFNNHNIIEISDFSKTNNPFVNLNNAFLEEGCVINFEKNTEKEIKILNIVDNINSQQIIS